MKLGYKEAIVSAFATVAIFTTAGLVDAQAQTKRKPVSKSKPSAVKKVKKTSRKIPAPKKIPSGPPSPTSDAANIVFSNTGQVLYSKNPFNMRDFASIAKFVTLTVVFDEIKKGNLRLTDTRYVTYDDIDDVNQRKCVGTGARTIEALIERAAVHSCNDSASVLAKIVAGLPIQRDGKMISINRERVQKAGYVLGSEKTFANLMVRELADKLGIQLIFDNASGLPWYAVSGGTKNNRASASALGKIGLYMAKNHPDLLHYLAMSKIELEEEKEIRDDGSVKEAFLGNTNGLFNYTPEKLGALIGVERATIVFSKTGTTRGAGSCVMLMLKIEDKGREYEFLIVTLGNASGAVRSGNVIKLAQMALEEARKRETNGVILVPSQPANTNMPAAETPADETAVSSIQP